MTAIEFASMQDLMAEIDVNVRKVVDIFRFALVYRVLFKGGGIEFAGLREYVPGEDDASRIDWKASLRSKNLYVKEFEEERNLDVFILLDSSRSMLFGTQGKLKSEYAAVVAGTLAYAGIESGDNVGFSMFSDSPLVSIPPSNDVSVYYRILELMGNPRYWGGGCNLNGALLSMVETVEEKSILFVVSDFIGVGEEWFSALKTAAGKFNRVFGIMVRDVRDSFIPEGVGAMRVEDPFTGRVATVNLDSVRRKYEEEARRQEDRILNEFHNSGAAFIKVYTTDVFVDPLLRYIEMF